ncbi:MAG: DUF5054 domain-containing protein [Anaerolineaceae bacterium]|nr:DUF5054 domain-containing protein [Anaerolineaceae bacterium]
MLKKIILVFKSHFDIGFTDLAENVIRNYGGKMLREVIETCRSTENMGDLRYVWTMPSWPLRYIIDHCEPELKPELDRLIHNGQIVWHALPFTSHTDCCAPEEYAAALQYSRELSERYQKPYPISGKMTDVPGHGLMLPELLSQTGIRFLHLGCNEFATPPDVPCLFFWESPQGGRVLTMYSKGGYGTSLLPPKDWHFPVWMALMHTNDNCGPQTAGILTNLVEKARRAYPDAEIVCGTMDDFYREMKQCDLSSIPVINDDLADTWIHGIGSYPKEVSDLRHNRLKARRLHRSYAEHLLQGSDPIPEWNTLWNEYYEQTALFEEHTWGADVKTWLGPNRVYEKEVFLKERTSAPYRFMESSWDEQKRRMQAASDTLDRISLYFPQDLTEKKKLSEIRYKKEENRITAETDLYRICFRPSDGLIETVEDLQLGTVILKESNDHGVFSYQYDRAGIEDVTEFLRKYGYRFTDWGILDYGRSKYPECEHLCFSPEFTGYEANSDSLRFWYRTKESSEQFGDCRSLSLTLTFPGDGDIDAVLNLDDKQASPFIEAGSFIIPLAEESHYLLGRPCAVVDPEKQIIHCANHSFFCLENSVNASGRDITVTVTPQDTPLMAIGSSGLYEYEPEFPKSRSPELWFNLFNNMWGTNFPQWIEGNFSYRFTIRAAKPGENFKPLITEEYTTLSGIPADMEVVNVRTEDGIIYLLLRDHSGTAEPQTISIPGKMLCQTDLWHRPVNSEQPDRLTIPVRPYGIHCVAIREKGMKQ